MLNRLHGIILQPKQILDVGCGIGTDLLTLSQRFPAAQVYGLDLAEDFLIYGKRQQASTIFSEKINFIVADAISLPFSSHSVDLIFANLLIPWCAHPKQLLREWRRVLRPHGLLFFSCLGPDTFKEWQGLEGLYFLPSLVDMHIVGDALVEEGFVDPVLEVDQLHFTYRCPEKLEKEMRRSGLLAKMMLSYPPMTTTFEVIYAHAWCPATKGFKANAQGEVSVPISQLR